MDEAEGEVWQSKKICFSWLAALFDSCPIPSLKIETADFLDFQPFKREQKLVIFAFRYCRQKRSLENLVWACIISGFLSQFWDCVSGISVGLAQKANFWGFLSSWRSFSSASFCVFVGLWIFFLYNLRIAIISVHSEFQWQEDQGCLKFSDCNVVSAMRAFLAQWF